MLAQVAVRHIQQLKQMPGDGAHLLLAETAQRNTVQKTDPVSVLTHLT